jgi:hypothetical protein
MNFQQLTTNLKTLCLLTAVTLTTVGCSVNDASPPDEAELYISIPNAQFEQRLIDQGIDSEGALDQQLLKTDAEAITHLDLNWSGGEDIRDLTGIEGFVNLTTLTAAQQELEQIDLSFNTRLDTLYLAGNILQEIDLSNNTQLVDVNLGTNELSSVEGLSGLNRLKVLDLSWNYLKQFSISNSSVERIFLNLNELEALNISQAANLKSLVVTSNQLIEISLDANTALEIVVMSDNSIQSVDLSQNQELQYFYASSNTLTSLDVSSNSKLIDLRVDRNPSLTCIKIHEGQEIPTVALSDGQEMRSECG